MANTAGAVQEPEMTENFAALLDESFGDVTSIEGSVVKGTVISVDNDAALIDVGLKSEGRVALKEFGNPGQKAELKPGDIVEVYVERMEDRNGEAMLSREKARREEAWAVLETGFENNERVTGTIFGRVKGGFTVDLSGAVAFLPGSQVDIRPVRDIGPLLGTPQPFQILKMDRRRGNIVVSRRAVLEESRAEARSELVANLQEGQVLQGVVKNITASTIRKSDLSRDRSEQRPDRFAVGEKVDAKITQIDNKTRKLTLSIKAREVEEEKKAMADYGSSDSGASLGDILGAALKQREEGQPD